jgi:hypothetical protein
VLGAARRMRGLREVAADRCGARNGSRLMRFRNAWAHSVAISRCRAQLFGRARHRNRTGWHYGVIDRTRQGRVTRTQSPWSRMVLAVLRRGQGLRKDER